MLDTDRWFDRLRRDTERAQEALKSKTYAAFHYYSGCLIGTIRVIRELAEIEEQESTKP